MSTKPTPKIEELLTPQEAARLLGVSPKTVARWADEGRLAVITTLGGHRRFRRSEVERAMESEGVAWEQDPEQSEQ